MLARPLLAALTAIMLISSAEAKQPIAQLRCTSATCGVVLRGGAIHHRQPFRADTQSFGTGNIIDTARRFLGGNPTRMARQWCGAFLRLVVPHDPGASFNLARSWAHYGRASHPQVGSIVVFPHHVGIVTQLHDNGTATVISGNDGRRVRERIRSLRGAIAFRAL